MKPPTVRPMTPHTRQRIRRDIMDRARRRHRSHGWIPAVVAVAGVVAVAMPAGQLIQAGENEQDSGPATSPRSSPTWRPDPRAVVVDRGVPSAAQLRAAKNSCAEGTVLFARRVLWRPAPITPLPVTAVVIRTADGKHLACHDMDDKDVSSLPEPTATDPVKGFAITGMAVFYRVHPSVARLESRVTFPANGWSVAVISNGIAYAVGDLPLQGPARREVRAFDAAGRPIPLPTPIPMPTPTPTR